MRPRARRPLIFAAVLGLFAFPARAQMADRLGGLPGIAQGGDGELAALAITHFTIVGSIQLAPLTAADVLGVSGPGLDLGTWFPGADPTAGVTLNTAVVRVADAIWDAWFNKQNSDTSNIQVELALTGGDNTPGALTHAITPSSRMYVTVLPTTPIIIDSQGNRRQIQGGAQFLLDCSLAALSGSYRGSLLVTVNQL